ncbi:MAG: hypothetical protein ACTSYS_13850 [Promethearchaeota archaeon]
MANKNTTKMASVVDNQILQNDVPASIDNSTSEYLGTLMDFKIANVSHLQDHPTLDVRTGYPLYLETKTYRLVIYSNLTVFVFNYSSNVDRDFQKKYSQSISISNIAKLTSINTIDKLYAISLDSNKINVTTFTINDSAITKAYSFHIYTPSSFTVSTTQINYIYADSYIHVVGNYVLSNSSKIPLYYRVNEAGSFIEDSLGLNTTSNYSQIGETLYFINSLSVTDFMFVSNDKFGSWDKTTYSVGNNYTSLPSILDFTTIYHYHFSKLREWTLSPSSRKIASFELAVIDNALTFYSHNYIFRRFLNNSQYTYEIKTTDELFGWNVYNIYKDTFINVIPDLSDGALISISDVRSTIWQSLIAKTGNYHGGFDWYYPTGYAELNNETCEIAISDSKSLYVVILTRNLSYFYNMNTTTIDSLVLNNIRINHVAGDSKFVYQLSGYIIRNTTDSVEINVQPILVKPDSDNFMFNTTSLYYVDTKVSVIPTRNFIGVGSNYIEFSVWFEIPFCAIIDTFSGLKYVDLKAELLISEKMENGTYIVHYFDMDVIDNSFYDYNFNLETRLAVSNALLDEIAIRIDNLEINPYAITFQRPFSNITIIDKITNKTIYNSTDVLFSDPLAITTIDRYEFHLSFYSNLDKFGLDFNLVNVFVNDSEVNSEDIRILSDDAKIVVKDFADNVLYNTTINKEQNGSYIKIGLDIAQVIINNRYNFTINFFLIKNDTTIYYQVPDSQSIVLRLALGSYRYRVEYANGTEIFDKNVTISYAKSIDIGVPVGFPSIPPSISPTVLNLIIIFVIGILFFVGTIAIIVFFRKQSSKSRRLRYY